MLYKRYKIFINIFIIVVFAIAFSLVNKYYLKKRILNNDDLYKNDISKTIVNNNDDAINTITYDSFKNDLDDIDTILTEQIASGNDLKKKTNYYKVASNVYENKINELMRVLNNKLDDEDFERLQYDLDELRRNMDYAISDLENTLESTVELEFYSSKYKYEELKSKCHEILETYKGFFN